MFERYELNEQGKQKLEMVNQAFEALMVQIHVVSGRERSLMMTKLEEAAYYASRAIEMDFANRK